MAEEIFKPISEKDRAGIDAAIKAYVDGTGKADVDLCKQAFHPEAILFGEEYGTFFGGPIQLLYDTIPRDGADPDAKVRFDLIVATPTTAIVRLELDNAKTAGPNAAAASNDASFTDFLSLVKRDGMWKIMCKVYHRYR